eukprot:TRINITY_DN80457_c0_g1_i1.p1 TRINITY_DN80457_c0_g1~~TRINITY_DN80457_c0_g1_i1.p1  ORF type:complete len:244 (+),score=42.38 TRINITY_DN80457_c0_g1_i1:477-1208(+)
MDLGFRQQCSTSDERRTAGNPDDDSHAWLGSILESDRALQQCVASGIPDGTAIFFCTFCMYQPGDKADGSLTIADQLALEPFAKIIESKPRYGMRVIHTSIFEVYRRMWTVHEVDEGCAAGIPMHGLFDFTRFRWAALEDALEIDTKQAECRPEDRDMLDRKIMNRGGYERLDRIIRSFREKMKDEFTTRVESPETREILREALRKDEQRFKEVDKDSLDDSARHAFSSDLNRFTRNCLFAWE